MAVTPGENLPVSISPDGIMLHVRVAPKSGIAGVDGIEYRGGKSYLKVRVTAPPEDGKANAAVAATVASWIGVPKSAITIRSGHRSRIKSLSLASGEGELALKIIVLLKSLTSTQSLDRSLAG